MAEAACANLSGRLETEVTSRFISCSMLSFFSASADALESGCWANPGSAKQMRPKVRSIDVAGATVLGSAIGSHLLVYHASRTSIMPGRRDVQLPAGQRAEADDDDHAPGDARDPGGVQERGLILKTEGGTVPGGVLGRFCGIGLPEDVFMTLEHLEHTEAGR